MAISFIGITSKVGEADGSWDIPIHASAVAGDFAVIFYANDNSVTASVSGTSETIPLNFGASSTSGGAWSKVLTSGEITAGVVTVTDSGGNGLSGACVMGVWRDANSVFLGGEFRAASNFSSFPVGDTSLTGGGHYFAVAFMDDDLTTISSYPNDYTLSQSSLQCGSTDSGGTLAWARTESLPTDPTNAFVFNSSDTGVCFAFQIDGATTYNETITETLTAADSFAAAATVNAAISETATATDSFLGGKVYAETISETVTASGAFLGGSIWVAAISESIAASDIYAATIQEPNGWIIPAPPVDGWVQSGAGSGAWIEVSDTGTDWTEI